MFSGIGIVWHTAAALTYSKYLTFAEEKKNPYICVEAGSSYWKSLRLYYKTNVPPLIYWLSIAGWAINLFLYICTILRNPKNSRFNFAWYYSRVYDLSVRNSIRKKSLLHESGDGDS